MPRGWIVPAPFRNDNPQRRTAYDRGVIQVVANGRTYELGPATTVAGFIRARGLDPRYVVVEHNGEPLERARYEDATLGDGDRLELVRAVAGG
jgi:sulfur carrier protein